MAFDTFLKITSPDVNGESTRGGFEKWIEIYSFSWGASNPTTVSPGATGLSAGRVSISSFNVMKKTEMSSPTLFAACCMGVHYGKVEVKLNKAAGDKTKALDFLTYTFEDVMVESVQWSGSAGGDDTPTESVSLAFAKVSILYESQSTAKGSKAENNSATWDLTKVQST